VITSANVTIDLAGFAIDGAGAALIGIYSKRDNVTIRGGTIIRFTAYGNQGTGNSWIIENMRVASNGADGINVADTMRIVGNIVSQNTGYGIRCNNFCHVEGNVISQNAGFSGLYIGTGTALGNTIVKNTGYGMYMSYGAFGNNTLILNNNNQAGNQVLGAYYNLHPNFCNPACP